eukprot:104852_1
MSTIYYCLLYIIVSTSLFNKCQSISNSTSAAPTTSPPKDDVYIPPDSENGRTNESLISRLGPNTYIIAILFIGGLVLCMLCIVITGYCIHKKKRDKALDLITVHSFKSQTSVSKLSRIPSHDPQTPVTPNSPKSPNSHLNSQHERTGSGHKRYAKDNWSGSFSIEEDEFDKDNGGAGVSIKFN